MPCGVGQIWQPLCVFYGRRWSVYIPLQDDHRGSENRTVCQVAIASAQQLVERREQLQGRTDSNPASCLPCCGKHQESQLPQRRRLQAFPRDGRVTVLTRELEEDKGFWGHQNSNGCVWLRPVSQMRSAQVRRVLSWVPKGVMGEGIGVQGALS